MYEKQLNRLEERFRINSEAVLENGSLKTLLSFRERSRTLYQPEAQRIEREFLAEIQLLELNIPGVPEIEEFHKKFIETIKRVQSKFISSPNRFLRNCETVKNISSSREKSGRKTLLAESSDNIKLDLIETDPPVKCPVCDGILLTDRKNTILVCSNCGIEEKL